MRCSTVTTSMTISARLLAKATGEPLSHSMPHWLTHVVSSVAVRLLLCSREWISARPTFVKQKEVSSSDNRCAGLPVAIGESTPSLRLRARSRLRSPRSSSPSLLGYARLGGSSGLFADTGPINYLVLIGHIGLLPTLFQKVILPSAVQRELDDGETPPSVRDWIANPPVWVEVKETPVRDLNDDSLDGLGPRRTSCNRFGCRDQRRSSAHGRS